MLTVTEVQSRGRRLRGRVMSSGLRRTWMWAVLVAHCTPRLRMGSATPAVFIPTVKRRRLRRRGPSGEHIVKPGSTKGLLAQAPVLDGPRRRGRGGGGNVPPGRRARQGSVLGPGLNPLL